MEENKNRDFLFSYDMNFFFHSFSWILFTVFNEEVSLFTT